MTDPRAYLTNADPLPDALPQEALLAMVEAGEVIAVAGFEDFMCANLHWIEPTEFGDEFARLTVEGHEEEIAPEAEPETLADRALTDCLAEALQEDEFAPIVITGHALFTIGVTTAFVVLATYVLVRG